MGLNLVVVCHVHKKYNYCYRSEEFVDFQALMRSEHRECMKMNQVTVHCDADDHYHSSDSGYTEMWPYEQRPEVVGAKVAAIELGSYYDK
jgi:hypothetical protein